MLFSLYLILYYHGINILSPWKPHVVIVDINHHLTPHGTWYWDQSQCLNRLKWVGIFYNQWVWLSHQVAHAFHVQCAIHAPTPRILSNRFLSYINKIWMYLRSKVNPQICVKFMRKAEHDSNVGICTSTFIIPSNDDFPQCKNAMGAKWVLVCYGVCMVSYHNLYF